MSVSRAELDLRLAELRSEIKDPRAGIHGSDSFAWQISKESILFLGGGKAALLQLAHPFVAHAIDQHSQTRSDPLGRFQRTFDAIFRMVFGDFEQAERAARRVHAIHSRVTGSIAENVGSFTQGNPYAANDEHALLWVHATLIETAVQVYDLLVRPLAHAERNRYYQETKRFAKLFGIPERIVPRDWNEFVDYYQRTLDSDVIRVGRPARELARFLFEAPSVAQRPLFGWLEVMTAGLLPEKLRREFGFDFGFRDRALFRASLFALSRSYRHLPARLREAPGYTQACRRVAGKPGPDRFARLWERVLLSALGAKR